MIKRTTWIGTVALLLLLPLGCVASKQLMRPDASEITRTVSYALLQTENTTLGQALADDIETNAGMSGFKLLPDGMSSFDARLSLIQSADKTLDFQYYIMNDDATANLLLHAILQAAERGVRVRMLLDNIGIGEIEYTLAVLDNVQNIEIRIFNPLFINEQSLVSRMVGLLTDVGHATKRMHNKALIADNQAAVVGGRNLGDEYFDADMNTVFYDLDVLAAGPVTAEISRSFDQYWNSEQSFPIKTVRKEDASPQKVAEMRAALKQNWDRINATEDGKKFMAQRLSSRIDDGSLKLVWAPGEVLVDKPEKVEGAPTPQDSKTLIRMADLAERAEKDFLIVSPYFVPRKEGVEWLAALVDRGVRVRVLTNSLASTDVVAVHSGYKNYRRDLLKAGVELYEMKPIGDKRPRQRLFGSKAPPQANLHTKLYTLDHRDVIVGSFNFDPRSIELNTEISIVMHSPELAQQMEKILGDSLSGKGSYRLVLDDRGTLQWLTMDGDKKQVYNGEPEAGFGRRLQTFIFSALPIEGQL